MRVRMVLFYVINTTLLHSSRNILKHHWFPRSEFPCRHIQWTCEHVIPKSLIPEHNDLHNLILLPNRLNNIRSNFPYTNGIRYEDLHDPHLKVKPILPCMRYNCSCHDLQGKLISKHLFVPPDRFKGMISRCVLYMKDKYPHQRERIHKKVLDLGVASVWDISFPPSLQEMEWNKFVASYQGDDNPYVLHHRRMA